MLRGNGSDNVEFHWEYGSTKKFEEPCTEFMAVMTCKKDNFDETCVNCTDYNCNVNLRTYTKEKYDR